MKEENNGTPKNKWSRILRKKWFFPALYLTLAALLLSGVIWYQNVDNQVKDTGDDQGETEEQVDGPYDQDAEPVADQQEAVKMPVEDADQAEIVTKFFDYNADEEDQESALVHYNNLYYQSTGIDIASSDDEEMDVKAALSGKVKEVKEDPLMGNLVELSHENDTATYYASLDEVNAEEGDKIEQGDNIGTAGKNVFGEENGEHVHFELRKDGEAINPEEFFNQPVSKLDSATTGEEDEENESDAEDDSEATGEETETGNEDEADESDHDKQPGDEDTDDDDMEDSDQPGVDDNDEGDIDSDQPGLDGNNEDENNGEQEEPDNEQPDNKDSEGLKDSDGATSQSSDESKDA